MKSTGEIDELSGYVRLLENVSEQIRGRRRTLPYNNNSLRSPRRRSSSRLPRASRSPSAYPRPHEREGPPRQACRCPDPSLSQHVASQTYSKGWTTKRKFHKAPTVTLEIAPPLFLSASLSKIAIVLATSALWQQARCGQQG